MVSGGTGMSLVKVKAKYQVTLPSAVREAAGVDVGDLLEAEIRNGKIILTPKSIIDRRVAESLEDFEKGRTYGPFTSADEVIRSLRGNIKKIQKGSKRG
jgi:AbrB family looped-hinge helix DNA binding protein